MWGVRAGTTEEERSMPATTHEVSATTYYRTFSRQHAVLARIAPGDTVRTTCVDAGGVDQQGVTRSEPGNPLTGAFYIEGVEPGDALVVRFDRVRCNRTWGWSANRLCLASLLPETVETLYSAEYKANLVREGLSNLVPWDIDLERGTVRLREPEPAGISLKFGVQPMIGCVGVAAPGEFAPTSGPSGAYGGNIDYNRIGEGSTVYLPVFHPGGLLFVGDGHALQGTASRSAPRSRPRWPSSSPSTASRAPLPRCPASRTAST
jgi:acetamidase/formamidase